MRWTMCSEANHDWPFPSVRTYSLLVPGKGSRLTLSGDQKVIESYLKRFGCVPVFDGSPGRRRLARPSANDQWEISELDGTTELETPPRPIEGTTSQLEVLTSHTWYYVGYADRRLIEFDFGVNGEGFSRCSIWGHGTVIPDIRDYYWRFSVADSQLSIGWEKGSDTTIAFTLIKELRIAQSLANGDLGYFQAPLNVNSPLFPPRSELAESLITEYWAVPKEIEGEE